MSSYLGRHAELYDIFYADKPYREEAGFVHKCLQRCGDDSTFRLLELACGTGAHALEFEKMGYKIVATDYSKDMLSRAKQKAMLASSKIDFRWQDMRSLDLFDRPFDVVVCLFDSIGYVETNEALEKVFRGVYDHLRPGGIFIFEFWHAGAMVRSYEPVRVRRWQVPGGGEVLRISETSLDFERQLARVHYTVYEFRDDGTYSSFSETQANRFFLVQEIAAWLGRGGFKPLGWYAGYQDDEPITDETWHVIAVARRV